MTDFDLDLGNGTLTIQGETLKAEVVTMKSLREVMANPEKIIPISSNAYPMYYTFKGFKEVNDLRFDFLVIPVGVYGDEYNKTYGAFYPYYGGSKVTHAGLYQVLKGNAHFILQKVVEGTGLEEVIVVKANRGDVVIIPPNYGFTIVNPHKKEQLILTNIISKNIVPDSTVYKIMRGASYYEMTHGYMINPSYRYAPEIKINTATEWNRVYAISKHLNSDIYEVLVNTPDKLDFIKDPYKLR